MNVSRTTGQDEHLWYSLGRGHIEAQFLLSAEVAAGYLGKQVLNAVDLHQALPADFSGVCGTRQFKATFDDMLKTFRGMDGKVEHIGTKNAHLLNTRVGGHPTVPHCERRASPYPWHAMPRDTRYTCAIMSLTNVGRE